jgi:hypothetical protein
MRNITDEQANRILKCHFGGLLLQGSLEALMQSGYIKQDVKRRTNNLLKVVDEVTSPFWDMYSKGATEVEQLELQAAVNNVGWLATNIAPLSSLQIHMITTFIYRLTQGQFEKDALYNMREDFLLFKQHELLYALGQNIDVYFNELKKSNSDLENQFTFESVDADTITLKGITKTEVILLSNNTNTQDTVLISDLPFTIIYELNNWLYENYTIEAEFIGNDTLVELESFATSNEVLDIMNLLVYVKLSLELLSRFGLK